MGQVTWIRRLAWCVALSSWQPASARVPDASREVCVLLQDLAGVPTDTLADAKHEVVRIFARSALTLNWTGGNGFTSRCLTVRIATNPADGHRRDRRVLGAASITKNLRGRFASVFYERIRVASAEVGLRESLMLGHVMAHELGHLLLPYRTHPLAGVMRAAWDRPQVNNAAAGLLAFTPAEVSLIRQHLTPTPQP